MSVHSLQSIPPLKKHRVVTNQYHLVPGLILRGTNRFGHQTRHKPRWCVWEQFYRLLKELNQIKLSHMLSRIDLRQRTSRNWYRIVVQRAVENSKRLCFPWHETTYRPLGTATRCVKDQGYFDHCHGHEITPWNMNIQDI